MRIEKIGLFHGLERVISHVQIPVNCSNYDMRKAYTIQAGTFTRPINVHNFQFLQLCGNSE